MLSLIEVIWFDWILERTFKFYVNDLVLGRKFVFALVLLYECMGWKMYDEGIARIRAGGVREHLNRKYYFD